MAPLDGVAVQVAVFAVAGVVVLAAGSRISPVADRLADRTGMGEALTGALLLGGATSLSGITTSVTAAADGHPQLAMANAIGGIAVQTAWLGFADLANRGANLEHAAASVPNTLSSALLTVLLAGVLLIAAAPEVTVWGVHPASLALVVVYVAGLVLVRRTREHPQWRPRVTPLTRLDTPDTEAAEGESLTRLWVEFGVLAALLAGSGWAIAWSGAGLAAATGIDETIVGGLFMAVATSTPELVTAVAAVRAGALTLAVGDVIGGNAFDVLFAAAADVAYRDGSIYHAMAPGQTFLVTLSAVMAGVLVMGLVYRERRGVGNIGFESAAILALYVGGFLVLALSQL